MLTIPFYLRDAGTAIGAYTGFGNGTLFYSVSQGKEMLRRNIIGQPTIVSAACDVGAGSIRGINKLSTLRTWGSFVMELGRLKV